MGPLRLAEVEGVAGREIGEIAGPVDPGGDEAGEIAEAALAPDVEAAFLGVTGRKLDDRKHQWNIKAEPGGDPDGDGAGAGAAGGGDPAQADGGYDVEQDEVDETHDAGWMSACGFFRACGCERRGSRSIVGRDVVA